MTVKGQVTVPKVFRDAFGWKAGDKVEFVRDEEGLRIVTHRPRSRGEEIVARLRDAPWNRRLSTDRLMTMTRGRVR